MPLYLSRCATVLSLQQLLDEASDEKHSGAHVMESVPELTDNMSLPIMECSKARLSRYRFPLKAQVSKVHRISSVCSMDDAQCVPNIDDESMGSNTASDEDDVASSMGSILEPGTVPQKSLLDAMLLALWEDCAEQGLFRYDVTACPTKVLPGIYGFVAQLNEGRATKKRATEFRVDQVRAVDSPGACMHTCSALVTGPLPTCPLPLAALATSNRRLIGGPYSRRHCLLLLPAAARHTHHMWLAGSKQHEAHLAHPDPAPFTPCPTGLPAL